MEALEELIMLRGVGFINRRPLTDSKENMDPIERLLSLYKAAQTDSERRILLEAAHISNPDDFPHLEDVILRDQVRGMTYDRHVEMIASHRNVSLQQADELLRHTVLEHLLDRRRLKAAGSPCQAASLDAETVSGTKTERSTPLAAAPPASRTAAASHQTEPPEHGSVQVVILEDPVVIANGEPEEGQNRQPSPAPAPTPFGRLQPRGIS